MYEWQAPIVLDRSSSTALRVQLVEQIKIAIESGALAPDDPLPSTRSGAEALGIARNTVLASYLELEGDGWVYSIQGSGTFVARRSPGSPHSAAIDIPREPAAADETGSFDMRPGSLDPSLILTDGWRSAWRNISPSPTAPPPCGLASLRSSLAEYLRSARGLACDPSEIIVCAGTSEAITLLGLALQWHGQPVAIEDPGYIAVRQILRRIGATCVPIDVTRPELVPDVLESTRPVPVAIYLTPSHQFPLGHRMEEHDRRQIVEWANRTGSVVIEDDYDGEFRFGVAPLPSMAGIDPHANTVYVGTMSKVLDPALRMAYLRVPPHLKEVVTASRDDMGSTVAGPVQAAVVHLLRTGEFSRHIARVRRIYSDRRKTLLRALSDIPAVVGILGIEAGLHVVCQFESYVDVPSLVSQLSNEGVLVQDLDDLMLSARERRLPGAPAIVMHYGGLTPARIRQAVDIMGRHLGPGPLRPEPLATPDRR